jgi:DNA (cytosine-5)-methyltransferase 1
MVFETVCTDLEGEGYEVRAFNIPAAGVGAPHRRERIWIVAHRKESMVNADDVRFEQHNETKEETSWWRTSTTFEPTSDVVNTISNGERREISRSDEEERRIQKEYRQDDSSSRLTSRTSSIRQTNNGHEDVANAYARLSDGTYKEVQSGRQTFDTSSEGSEDVANTESSDRHDNEAVTGDGESQTQEIFGNGSSLSGESSWWHVEPDVGRVAHGIPGRVYRLKGLGNSIVPKIVEEIGYAIIKAAERKE